MANPFGFLGAAGQFFTGLGQDQQNAQAAAVKQQQMAQAQQLHNAQIADYQAQAQQRTDATAQRQREASVWQQFGPAAQAGDPSAIAQIVGTLGEKGAAMLKTLTAEPKGQYDGQRGGFVTPDGHFTPVAGLPPLPEKDRDHWTSAGVDPITGQPILLNTASGETKIGGGIRSSGRGAQSPTGQLQQGRMLAAVSEARLADERMRAFEDKLLEGGTSIGPLAQAAGSLTSNLAGSHSVSGAAIQAASEYGLNTGNAPYAQYLRDASTIGRAEQMIMPKGGTETMVRANALLARAGSGANKATIDAARMARQALFGKAGGLEQAMSPAQSAGLDQGVQRIKAGEGSPTSGRPPLPPRAGATPPPAGKPSLQERVRQLKARGMSRPQAMQTLQQEGYDLHGGD